MTSIATHVYFKTDGGNIHQVVMPVGLEMKVGLSDMINLDLGYNMSFVDSDNLDGSHFVATNDRCSYSYLRMEIALGDLAKPQLESYNPADALSYNNMVKNREQRDQLAANNEKMAKMHADMQRLLGDSDGDGVSE